MSHVLDGLWKPAFPSAELVGAAAAMFTPAECGWRRADLREGPTWRITISPGTVQVATLDYARLERTEQRRQNPRDQQSAAMDERRQLVLQLWARAAIVWQAGRPELAVAVAAVAVWTHRLLSVLEVTSAPAPRGRVTEWTNKSRARMIQTLSDLDWAPLFADGGVPAMVTLTLPGDWLAVFPDAATAVERVKTFRKRWERSWGAPLVGPWKREFQRRGAWHLHVLTVPPRGLSDARYAYGGLPFRTWLSRTWTDVLQIADPVEREKSLAAGTGVDFADGLRSTDPRRIAVYFTGHGLEKDKEYQNQPPAEWLEQGSVGRWWGYWGLRPCRVPVEVEAADAVHVARTMRRWSRARQYYREVRRPRGGGVQVQSKYPEVIGLAGAQLVEAARPAGRQRRRTTVRGYQVRRGRGWVSVNDAPAFAGDLARAVEARIGEYGDPLQVDSSVRAAVRRGEARRMRSVEITRRQ